MAQLGCQRTPPAEGQTAIPATTERVPLRTPEHVSEQIRQQTRNNVARWADAGPAAIAARLKELDREWDVERTLEANASLAVLTGVALGALGYRKWFYFQAVVCGFLLLHAVESGAHPCPSSAGWAFAPPPRSMRSVTP